mmetsp:Transcript_34827/g.74202  ORF Transcript_34827/g.74202 Transcript_34827/m.74202 type:complete len:228 (+) Transcript_34827:198-881(+)
MVELSLQIMITNTVANNVRTGAPARQSMAKKFPPTNWPYPVQIQHPPAHPILWPSSELELHPGILVHVLVQCVQHVRILHWSVDRHARPLPVLSFRVLHHTVVHPAALRHDVHDLRGERPLLVVLPYDLHFEHRGVLHERLEHALLFASDLVGVERVTVFVVLGIVYVIKGLADTNEVIAGGGLDDCWCSVVSCSCGFREALPTAADLCFFDDLFEHVNVITKRFSR